MERGDLRAARRGSGGSSGGCALRQGPHVGALVRVAAAVAPPRRYQYEDPPLRGRQHGSVRAGYPDQCVQCRLGLRDDRGLLRDDHAERPGRLFVECGCESILHRGHDMQSRCPSEPPSPPGNVPGDKRMLMLS